MLLWAHLPMFAQNIMFNFYFVNYSHLAGQKGFGGKSIKRLLLNDYWM